MNVVVAGKQPAPQWLTMDQAIKHCSAGLGIWEWASNDQGGEPDVVMACCGDVPTLETLAAVELLREHAPELKVRVVNVVDLMRLQPPSEHPHGMSDRDFDALFTVDKPIIFAFHGYPWLIHRLTYRRHGHDNIHVRGYKEEGTTTTPFDMCVLNDIDRFHLVDDVIDRVPGLASARRLRQAGDPRQADRAQGVHQPSRRRHAGDQGLGLGRRPGPGVAGRPPPGATTCEPSTGSAGAAHGVRREPLKSTGNVSTIRERGPMAQAARDRKAREAGDGRGGGSSELRLRRAALRRRAGRPLSSGISSSTTSSRRTRPTRASVTRPRRGRSATSSPTAGSSTDATYRRENPKRVYYVSIEFLIGRSLASNVMNLMLDPVVSKTFNEHGRVWMELLDQEPDAGLGNGGLGRLAACFLDSMATMALPAMGYGLRYEHGIFQQGLRNGWQEEKPDNWLMHPDPWEVVRPLDGSRSSSAAR